MDLPVAKWATVRAGPPFTNRLDEAATRLLRVAASSNAPLNTDARKVGARRLSHPA
jgi:hypothetical protein